MTIILYNFNRQNFNPINTIEFVGTVSRLDNPDLYVLLLVTD